MGIVYKAEDTRLKRTVALKFLPPECTRDEEAKKRFMHEARAASTLDHSNICNIYEIGKTEDGQMFLVMAHYEGQTLKERIAHHPLSIPEAIDIAIQISEGLQEAHQNHIVHRDIKSANIIITKKGQVKILDFGLAKLKGATKLTREGTTLGTVAVMSPEQARGEKIDHRSDIWSLGVLLYELITGQLPFKGEYEPAILYAIMNDEPEPVTGLRTGIPLELERIVKKALCKDPAYRYQHMDDFKVDLQQIQIQSSSGIKPADKRTKRRILPYTIPIGALLGITLLLLVSQILKKPVPEPKRKMLVVLPFENLGNPEDDYFTAGIHDEIITRLAMVRNLGVISRSSSLKYANIDKTIKEIGRDLGVQYILRGTVRWARHETGPGRVRISPHLISTKDDTHVWAETYDRVITDIFEVQTDIALKVVRALNVNLDATESKAVDIIRTDNMDAYHAFLKAQHLIEQPHFTRDMWPQVIRNYEKAVELDPKFALAWAELARAYARLVFLNLDLSAERRQEAIQAAKTALELNPESPKVHLALSYYHLWISRDTQKALQELKTAETGLPNSTAIMIALSNIYEVQGRFKEIIKIMKKAHTLNPLSTTILLNQAVAYWFIRQYPACIEVCNQALAMVPDEDWAHLFKVLCFWSWRGAVPEAREAIKKTRISHNWVPYAWFWQEIGERKYQQAFERLTTGNLEWIDTKIFKIPRSQALAYLHEFQGKSKPARKFYKQAKTILENEIKTANDPRLHSALGIVLASLGDREGAIRESERAIALLSVFKDAVYGTPQIHDIILSYTILGEYEKALDQVEYLFFKIPSVFSPGWMTLDPRWKRLENLPRFQKILHQYYKKFKY